MRCGHYPPAPYTVHANSDAAGTSAPKPSLVLLVDDDPEIRTLVFAVLSAAGYAIITADNGASALSLLDHLAHPPDLILLDQNMPVMDGDGFVRALHERRSGVPIMAFTSAAEGAEWAAQIQAAAFLAKPFAVEDLLAIVAQFARPG